MCYPRMIQMLIQFQTDRLENWCVYMHLGTEDFLKTLRISRKIREI